MSESVRSDVSTASIQGYQGVYSSSKATGDVDMVVNDKALSQGRNPRLTVLDTVQENNEGNVQAEGAPIVLVHIAVLRSKKTFHDVSSLLPDLKSRKTELLFRIHLDSLQVGDLVESVVEQQAIYLLQDLVAYMEQQGADPSDTSEKRPKPMFVLVAYDIGVAILKTAVWFAAKHPDIFPHILSRVLTVVFSGCPQRSPDGEIGMEGVLSNLLLTHRTTEKGDLTPLTLRSLARLMISTTGLFVASKLTLWSRVISIHGDWSLIAQIDPSITALVGSLDCPTEILVREDTKGDERNPFLSSSLRSALRSWKALQYNETLSSERETLRDMLLSLAPPHVSHLYARSSSSRSLDAIRSQQSFTDWRDHSGAQILYVSGLSDDSALEMAYRVISSCKGKLKKRRESAWCFETSFDDYSDGIPSMAASILTQTTAYDYDGLLFRRLKTLATFRTGWSRVSSFNLLKYSISSLGRSSILVLRNFDQCRKEDREIFLSHLSALSKRSELRFKIIVTSKILNALDAELAGWSVLMADSVIDHRFEKTYEPSNLLRQLPTDELQGYFQKHLEKIGRDELKSTAEVLRLLVQCSGWPLEVSAASLAEFLRLLPIATSTGSIEGVFGGIVRSRSGVRGFDRALGLLLCSDRRLSFRELIGLSLYREDAEVPDSAFHSLDAMKFGQQVIPESLRQSLCGLIYYKGSHVQLRPEIQQLMSHAGENYVWNQLRGPSHDTLFELCLSLLTSESSREPLSRMAGTQDMVPNPAMLVSPSQLLRREMIQFAVQALPHHLRNCPQTTISHVLTPESEVVEAALLAWAQAYWVSSSRLLRMPERPGYHLTILGLVGIGTYDELSKDRLSLAAAALSSRADVVDTWLERGHADEEDVIDALLSAVQAGNETLALTIFETLVARKREHIAWPVTILRAAAWNRMPRLLDGLLKHRVNPNSRLDYTFIEDDLGHQVTPPLIIASDLGLVNIFHALVDAGARPGSAVSEDESTLLALAADRGEPDIIKAVFERFPHVHWPKTRQALRWAASRGNWGACQLILDRDGDGDPSSDQEAVERAKQHALLDACERGYVETTRVLLEHGADPNVNALGSRVTPLWYAAVLWSDIRMVRNLLEHGADPNTLNRGRLLLENLVVHPKDDDDTLINICEALFLHHIPVDINVHSDFGGWTALGIASHFGRLPMINWLIEKGAEVNAVNHQLMSAVFSAANNDQRGAVKRLLKVSPKLDLMDSNGQPCLFYASSSPDTLALFLDAGASVEIASKQGIRLIHWTILKGYEDTLSMLLDRGVDVDALDDQGRSPIYYAVTWGTVNMVRLLVRSGARLKSTKEASLLHTAISRSSGMLRVVLEFRKFRQDLDLDFRNSSGWTPLMWARDDIECWELMIYAGADLNVVTDDSVTALHLAVESGMTPFRSILLSQPDIQVERRGVFGPALNWACEWLEIDAVTDLLGSSNSAPLGPAAPGFRYATPLVAAIHGMGRGDEDHMNRVEKKSKLIRLLISHGCDVQEKIAGRLVPGPLFDACLVSTPDVVTILLDEGASANEPSPIGHRYPLHYAAHNNVDMFRLIYEIHDGDTMVVDKGGKHCLHWAAQSGNARTISFILGRLKDQSDTIGSYVNTLDVDGWSPLCWALRPFKDTHDTPDIRFVKQEPPDYESTVRILLENGADAGIECKFGVGAHEETLTVLQLARKRDAGKVIIDMLKPKTNESDDRGGGQTANESLGASLEFSWCDVCFTVLIDPWYSCIDCHDWRACSKCYRNIQLYHDEMTQNDGRKHVFQLSKVEPGKDPTREPGENDITGGSVAQADSAAESDNDMTLEFSNDDDFTNDENEEA